MNHTASRSQTLKPGKKYLILKNLDSASELQLGTEEIRIRFRANIELLFIGSAVNSSSKFFDKPEIFDLYFDKVMKITNHQICFSKYSSSTPFRVQLLKNVLIRIYSTFNKISEYLLLLFSKPSFFLQTKLIF